MDWQPLGIAGVGVLSLAALGLTAARDRVTRRRLTLVVTDEAKDWLARAGYDADLGARPLRRVIQHSVEDPLALALLEGRYTDGDTVTVDASEGGITLR